jgi:hypothetical protein
VRRYGVSAYLIIAEAAQPALDCADLADVHVGGPVIRDEADRCCGVTSGKSVIDRLLRRA